jgi:hypothetical protein
MLSLTFRLPVLLVTISHSIQRQLHCAWISHHSYCCMSYATSFIPIDHLTPRNSLCRFRTIRTIQIKLYCFRNGYCCGRTKWTNRIGTILDVTLLYNNELLHPHSLLARTRRKHHTSYYTTTYFFYHGCTLGLTVMKCVGLRDRGLSRVYPEAGEIDI